MHSNAAVPPLSSVTLAPPSIRVSAMNGIPVAIEKLIKTETCTIEEWTCPRFEQDNTDPVEKLNKVENVKTEESRFSGLKQGLDPNEDPQLAAARVIFPNRKRVKEANSKL